MDLEAKKKWLDALESGKYHKTIGCLRDANEILGSAYCCLGVFCDVFKDEVNGEWDNLQNFIYDAEIVEQYKPNHPDKSQRYDAIKHNLIHGEKIGEVFGKCNPFSMPNPVLQKYGITDKEAEQLAEINDDTDTFCEVIDFIKARM